MTAEQCFLLDCLAQLNDDVWAQLLLPKLVADGSAASVALTCSTLRQLCQSSVQQLKLLFGGSTDTAAVRRWTEPLPDHFPACSRIELSICEESSIIFPTILDALARMPRLRGLECSVTLGQQPLAMVQAISSISSRLPQLRELVLFCQDSWEGAQPVWEQLGMVTQLTSLDVTFATAAGVRRAATLRNLAALRGLSGLQRLTTNQCVVHRALGQQQQQAGGQQQQQQEDGGSFEFLGALTALTHLDIGVPTITGLSSISSCTALQKLWLQSVTPHIPTDHVCLQAADWEAVGQLTRLTELCIGPYQTEPRLLLEQQQPFYAALEKLTRLQVVAAGRWPPAALPVLAGLPQLRRVDGLWSPQNDAAGAVCQHVTRALDMLQARCPLNPSQTLKSSSLGGL